MKREENILSLFHPLIGQWFTEKLGAPTDIQAQAWPVIARGRHVLVTAPTGSGKTLTAFLWAVHQLVTGTWGTGRTRVLYVSPLKALNNDIRRNLTGPLEELRARFHAADVPFPEIRVLTRSGDTPAEERRRMGRRPPEILLTTPESLNILLASSGGREMLTGIATVILDEIHAVAGTKRGTHLMTAVEHLVRIAGEFQRIALSATIRPLPVVADFVGGYVRRAEPGDGRPDESYEERPVDILASRQKKRLEIRVSFPSPDRETPGETSRWPALAASFRKIIGANRATLLVCRKGRRSRL